MSELMDRISKVFKTVFNDDSLVVNEETTAVDIPEWDSLQHINLLSMIEKEFNVEFDIDQIVEMENVGDIVEGVRQSLNKGEA